MTKILAAIVLGLAALTQSATAGNDTHVQKQNFVRPMINTHVFFKPAVQPIYKPIVIQHVVQKPIYLPVYHSIVTTHAGYKPSYHTPKHNYLPYTTYSYDSAPKNCTMILYKSDYGMVRKVWRCGVVEKVELAPAKIIERTIEKQVVVKQIIEKRSSEKEAPTDDTLPPK